MSPNSEPYHTNPLEHTPSSCQQSINQQVLTLL